MMTSEEIKKIMIDGGYELHSHSGDDKLFTFIKHFNNRGQHEPDVLKSTHFIYCEVNTSNEFRFTSITNRMSYFLDSGWMGSVDNDQHFVTNECNFAYYARLIQINNPF